MATPLRRNPLPRLLAGPLIWGTHFVLIYGLLSVGCAAGWQALRLAGLDLIRLLLLLLTVLAVPPLVWLVFGGLRPPNAADSAGFGRRAGAGLALLSLIAVVWEALPLAALAPCQ